MSRLQGPLRTSVLVRRAAFPHHGLQEKAATPGPVQLPRGRVRREAGLPLSWVSEACGGSGASLAEGFSVLSAAGRFALPVPLAETMLAGWLLSQANIASPDGIMTIAP